MSSAPRIILVGTKMAENVGAAARAMANFGFDDLWLVAPRCRLDDRAYALATHAGPVLDRATIVESTAYAVAGLTRVVGTTARVRKDDATPEHEPAAGLASLPEHGAGLMFGPEDFGLSNADLDLCQAYIRVPTADFASMNLAQAVNVICFAWFQGRAASVEVEDAGAPSGHAPAPRDEMERMYAQLADTLLRIGYTDPPRIDSVMRMMRGIFDAAQPRPRELAALRGLWSQVLWAARRAPSELPPVDTDASADAAVSVDDGEEDARGDGASGAGGRDPDRLGLG